MAYMFDGLTSDNVVSLIRSQNTSSIRVAEKIGERLRDCIEFYGGDVLVCGLSRKRWLESGGRALCSGRACTGFRAGLLQ